MKKVLFGLIGHDIHVVANRVIHYGLKERKIHSINLGTDNTPDDFVDAALEFEPDLVMVSSLNGEAMNWCSGFRERFEEIGMGDVILYIGGNLIVGEADSNKVCEQFRAFGFDRVSYGATDLNKMLDIVEKDIESGKSIL